MYCYQTCFTIVIGWINPNHFNVIEGVIIWFAEPCRDNRRIASDFQLLNNWVAIGAT